MSDFYSGQTVITPRGEGVYVGCLDRDGLSSLHFVQHNFTEPAYGFYLSEIETFIDKEYKDIKELQIALTGCDIPYVATKLLDLGITAKDIK